MLTGTLNIDGHTTMQYHETGYKHHYQTTNQINYVEFYKIRRSSLFKQEAISRRPSFKSRVHKIRVQQMTS